MIVTWTERMEDENGRAVEKTMTARRDDKEGPIPDDTLEKLRGIFEKTTFKPALPKPEKSEALKL